MPQEEAPGTPRPRAFGFGEFEVDLRLHRLTASGRPIAIEPRVFDALVYLIERRGRLVVKQELVDEVWRGRFVTDNALSRAVARLRHVLGDDTRKPRFIETVHGRGYRFVAAVEPLYEQPAGAVAEADRPPDRGRARSLAWAAALVLAVIAVWWTSRAARRGEAPVAGETVATPAVSLDPLRVAVLPLRNLGSGEDSRFFADGLTEQLISVLSLIDGVRVISGTTTMTYRDAGRRISEIARELGTGTVLAGSVRRDRAQLRVTVELIDAAREELLWSREFDTRLEDVFAVQSEVATRVADALQLSLPLSAVQRIREGPTREMTAYDHYLKGRQAYREGTRSGNETAIQHYRSALQIDPEFALASAGLANAYAIRAVRFGFGTEQRRVAEETARAALEADPSLPEAYKALGIVAYNRGRMRRALALNERALELNPSYDEALYNAASSSQRLGAWDQALLYQLQATNWVTGRAALASYLLVLGFQTEGERLAATVLAEEPLTRYLNLNLAANEWFGGDVDSARQRIGRIIAAEPTWPRGHRSAGDLELWQGNLAAARQHYQSAVDVSDPDDPESVFRLAVIEHLSGRADAAAARLAGLEEAVALDTAAGSENWMDYWLLGSIAALRGDADAAIEWRARAIRAGWRQYWRDATDPALASLRGDPRFEEQIDALRSEVETMRERVRPAVEQALPRILQAALG